MPAPIATRTDRLVVANIESLLIRQHKQQKDLAMWCKHTEPWLSAVLRFKRRLMLYDLDRIAEFFGLSTYQLFQPGINELYERRHGERRVRGDRRTAEVGIPTERRKSRLTPSAERHIKRERFGDSGGDARPVPSSAEAIRLSLDALEAAARDAMDPDREQDSAARPAVSGQRKRAAGGPRKTPR